MDIQQELERSSKDLEYFAAHRQELLKEHTEQWVAIYNQQVVAAAKDVKRLIKHLEKKGIPPGHVVRQYLTGNEDIWILAATVT